MSEGIAQNPQKEPKGQADTIYKEIKMTPQEEAKETLYQNFREQIDLIKTSDICPNFRAMDDKDAIKVYDLELNLFNHLDGTQPIPIKSKADIIKNIYINTGGISLEELEYNIYYLSLGMKEATAWIDTLSDEQVELIYEKQPPSEAHQKLNIALKRDYLANILGWAWCYDPEKCPESAQYLTGGVGEGGGYDKSLNQYKEIIAQG